VNATPQTPRQGIKYDGEKRQRLEAAFLGNPEADYRELAQLAGCSLAYAGQVAQELRIRRLALMVHNLVCHADIARIATETTRQIEILQERVSEAKDVDGASAFGRWLQGSGVIGVVRKIDPPLGQELAKKCKKLVEACGLRYEHNDNNPSPDAVKYQSLDEKINALTNAVAALTAKAA
jgi:hypothetical protein